MIEPDNERVVLAAAAGAAGLLVASLSGLIWAGAYFAGSFALFYTPELGPDERLLAYVIAPVLLAVARILPARYMGANRRLALCASVGVSVAASTVVILSEFDPKAISFALIAAPGVVALVAAVATGADPAVIPALVISTGFLIVAAVAMLSAEILALAVLASLSGWVLLPAAAGLFQPPADRRTMSRR